MQVKDVEGLEKFARVGTTRAHDFLKELCRHGVIIIHSKGGSTVISNPDIPGNRVHFSRPGSTYEYAPPEKIRTLRNLGLILRG